MGSWVRTITTPFRKACTIFVPQKDGKKPQQPNSGQCIHPQYIRPIHSMVEHVEAERAKLHGEVMACAYEDVQVMWSMLDQARIRDIGGNS
ncbi:hypothetical protein HU200_021318 [Digitaria exilis]|uniref:Uncharacterized protein n=1 Tax=Digitaria exilis TaxID=1010633 RepID=A0A835F074_9POAL|nr:hypothetical protein HU200_021318 [Digitaria exilis]